ncbi:hypothetical protein E2I00_005799 [Balaenoptera physalus]|uniref:Uncharacterized protein n=1 Tax=Balaenoptera physalus TaxID=9770 RepID=A0A6A1Q2Q9_BALPH|nr:hypothetical protein E2I00_005799 [Balaenoptera physalus]
MAFSELLQHVGNFGRFQIILAIASLSLVTLITTHNFVEIFSSAIPAYRCYIHLLGNTTSQINLTRNRTAHALLRISIPMGANKKQEQCHCFGQTQWQLLNNNDMTVNSIELETTLLGWLDL